VTQPWPTYDEKLTQVTEITLPIQINGKLKATIKVAIDTSEQEVVALAKQEQHISELLKGKIKKVIYIKNKILNFII
jgi:leucyl-tRNA synthetase